MEVANAPAKFPLAWATNASSGYVREIPTLPPPDPSQASLSLGFPPLNFSPISAGGVPPWGQDFNGIFRQITTWLQWVQAGGGVPYFDQNFADSVGGYPKGALLQSTAGAGNFWISTTDNNSANPDLGGSGWAAFPGPSLVQPSIRQTSNATFDFDCDTMVSLGLDRSAPTAMTVNLAATGTLILNQIFEVEDLSNNIDLGFVSVVPPAGHTIRGQANFVMNKAGQSARFKYYGNNLWSCRSS